MDGRQQFIWLGMILVCGLGIWGVLREDICAGLAVVFRLWFFLLDGIYGGGYSFLRYT